MQIINVGLNHKTAPVEVREKLAFTGSDLPHALACLPVGNGHGPGYVLEGVILSTCNRMEVYALVEDPGQGQEDVARFLSDIHNLPCQTFADCLTVRSEGKAVFHLCAIACGLDSMILGEPQILGQVAEAHQLALQHGAAGAVMAALFRQALRAGKRARTETAISQHAVSVSHAAVELAKRIFGDLCRCQVLLIGAGEMAELAAKNLSDNGVKGLSVINRSRGRAQCLAEQFGAQALGWECITQALWNVDIVISSTSAPHAIIHPDTVREAMLMRHNRPLFFVDIAVPRDVDPAVGDLPGVFLYNIDDLQTVVQTNLAHRKKEIPKVEAIINQEVAAFISWFRALDVVPTIVELRQHAEEIRSAELEKALRRLEDLSDRERNIIQALTHGIVNKILHQPTIRLKEHANSRDGYHYIEAIRDLFGLCYDDGKDSGGEE